MYLHLYLRAFSLVSAFVLAFVFTGRKFACVLTCICLRISICIHREKIEISPEITLFFKEYLKNLDTKIKISPVITLFFLGLAVVTPGVLAKMLWKREPTESPIWVTNTHHYDRIKHWIGTIVIHKYHYDGTRAALLGAPRTHRDTVPPIKNV